MIERVDHIAVAVTNLERRLSFWADALGLDVGGLETVESEQVKVAFLRVGTTRIELLEPLSEESPVGRSLAKRGEGLHHVTFAVRDLDEALGRLREHRVEILGGGARRGAGGTRVAFLHPGSAGGVLVELVEGATPAPSAEPGPGQAVLVYLREPQEKLWGVLRRLDAAGVVIEGIDLGSFDDWVAQVERGEEAAVGPSVLFVPMLRIEKILLDRRSGNLPSLAERFRERTGKSVEQALRRAAEGDG